MSEIEQARRVTELRLLRQELPSTINTLFFDLDGVLVNEGSDGPLRRTSLFLPEIDPEDFRTTARGYMKKHWDASPFATFGKELGIAASEALCLTSYQGDSRQMRAFYDWAKKYEYQVWSDVLSHYQIEDKDLTLGLSQRYREEKALSYFAYPGVPEVLTRLRGKYRLCIITNGVPEIQRFKLAQAGLTEYFGDNVIISGEVGVGKPDPKIFETAVSRLGVSADQVVMIGNSLETDIQGATNANIASIYIGQQEGKQGRRITTLDELVTVLEEV